VKYLRRGQAIPGSEDAEERGGEERVLTFPDQRTDFGKRRRRENMIGDSGFEESVSWVGECEKEKERVCGRGEAERGM